MYHSSNIGLLRLPEDSLGIPRLAGWCETVEAKIGVFWAMSQFLVRRFLGFRQEIPSSDFSTSGFNPRHFYSILFILGLFKKGLEQSVVEDSLRLKINYYVLKMGAGA